MNSTTYSAGIEDNAGVRTTFFETYDHEGNAWVTMKVDIEGDIPVHVDFNNPAQVESCMRQMAQYLGRRASFASGQESLKAAEPEPPYGDCQES